MGFVESATQARPAHDVSHVGHGFRRKRDPGEARTRRFPCGAWVSSRARPERGSRTTFPMSSMGSSPAGDLAHGHRALARPGGDRTIAVGAYLHPRAVVVRASRRSAGACPAGCRASARRHRPYLTVRVPSMPASRWPDTVQKNWYLPGLRSTSTVETPPLETTLPTSLTPAPETAMSWGTEDLFCESTVSLPAGAVAAAYW